MVLDNINRFFQIIFMIFGISPFVDKGITMPLPRVTTEEIQPKEKNIIRIFVNGKNKIFINKNEILLENIKDSIIKFIDRTDKRKIDNRCEAIVYLKAERSTIYLNYTQALDSVRAGFHAVRARELKWTIEKYKTFNDKIASKKDIKRYKKIVSLYPVAISETDPTDE